MHRKYCCRNLLCYAPSHSHIRAAVRLKRLRKNVLASKHFCLCYNIHRKYCCRNLLCYAPTHSHIRAAVRLKRLCKNVLASKHFCLCYDDLFMIAFAGDNGKGTVEGLEEYDTHQLMRKGELRYGETQIGGALHLIRETVG